MNDRHPFQLEIQVNDLFADTVSAARIDTVARATLARVGREQPTELTIVVTDNALIRALNRDYLGIDAPTDVLAFSQTEGADVQKPAEELSYLGDVVVSYEQAVAQAAEYGETVERELSRLVIHGLLHLLGYDDRDDDDRREMWRLQEQILDDVT